MIDQPYAVRTPRFERLVAKAVGRLLVWLARRAKVRGDAHEFRHMQAAVKAGNSQPCERASCCHLEVTRCPGGFEVSTGESTEDWVARYRRGDSMDVVEDQV